MGTSRPGGYATGRATKADIVAKATEVFREVGYSGASLREIARRCGISHATLQHHFADKAALLIAVLEQRDVEGRRSFPGYQGIDDLFCRMVDLASRNAESPGLVELFTVIAAEAADPGHPAHQFFQNRTVKRSIAENLALAQDNGEIDPALDPEELSTTIGALWDGLQLDAPLSPVPYDVSHHLELFFTLLLGRPLRRPVAPVPGPDEE